MEADEQSGARHARRSEWMAEAIGLAIGIALHAELLRGFAR
jgi:hypothetical protein